MSDIGSGFSTYTLWMKVSCPNSECEFEDLSDVLVDDWNEYWFVCPKCDYDDRLTHDVPF